MPLNVVYDKSMDLIFIIKIFLILGAILGVYAIFRNLDIIKIIINYWKDLILRK